MARPESVDFLNPQVAAPRQTALGRVPVVVLGLFALAVGVDLVRSSQGVSKYGDSDAVLQPRASESEYVQVYVRPQLGADGFATPSWAQLYQAYGLRDEDLRVALATYNRNLGAGVRVATPDSPIPIGTRLLLPVR